MLRSSSSFQFSLTSPLSLSCSGHFICPLLCTLCKEVVDVRSFHKINPISFPLRFTLPLKERRKKEDSVASVAIGKKELSSPLPKGSALRVFDGECVAQSDALWRASCEKALGSAADISFFFFFFYPISGSPRDVQNSWNEKKRHGALQMTKIKKYGNRQASVSKQASSCGAWFFFFF